MKVCSNSHTSVSIFQCSTLQCSMFTTWCASLNSIVPNGTPCLAAPAVFSPSAAMFYSKDDNYVNQTQNNTLMPG